MLFLNVAGLDRSAGVLEIGVPKLKIDAAGRITLSPEVLTHLGVGPGSELDVEMTETPASHFAALVRPTALRKPLALCRAVPAGNSRSTRSTKQSLRDGKRRLDPALM